jgi:hypothetical protein
LLKIDVGHVAVFLSGRTAIAVFIACVLTATG